MFGFKVGIGLAWGLLRVVLGWFRDCLVLGYRDRLPLVNGRLVLGWLGWIEGWLRVG